MDIPFNTRQLDELMAAEDIDALLVTSKHNVQYLLGGHRFFWFDYMDAVGVSRYLPVVVYFRGAPEASCFIGNAMEGFQIENEPIWVTRIKAEAWGVRDAMEMALDAVRERLGTEARLGIEPSFLPVDALPVLEGHGKYDLADSEFLLERLRACKNETELDLVEQASDRTVAAILEVFSQLEPGMTKRDAVDRLRLAEVERGLVFEYCLVSAGSSYNRAASDDRLEAGDVICLDSGGNYRGYIGDLARMAVLGDPDAELEDALAEIDAVQQAARSTIAAGTLGREVIAAGDARVAQSPFADKLAYVTHGMGLVSHEAPRLTATGPVPYPDTDADAPLMPGMVLSVETTLWHERRGFIKLEDTVLVTEDGHRAVGDVGRGWNVCGQSALVTA
ncbi:M24 family metallopeptidase [Leucobacter tenebrionis]|uniref:M24 family metallopeptidase n=1 Tax=Leucobacter tenebrionis TaxID=2873270 RepID=UPI001CA6FEE6|nr:Xaa-Pro peptidase family protein [Leucobacter tenebrionis]QZY50783.1 Xaa-Pro peptidase family protein [Leucobacter tenebrionis]